MMRRYAEVDPRAVEDLQDHFNYLSQGGLELAQRFLSAAETAFQRLSEMPELGSHQECRSPLLAGIRQWAVPGFRGYLIFYRPGPGAIRILRVLHGARDIDRILIEELDLPEA